MLRRILALLAGLLLPAMLIIPAVPAHAETHRATFTVTPWNEATDRAAPTHAGYVHDLLSNTTSGWARLGSNVYFGAEWYRGTADPRMTREWIDRHPGLHMVQRLAAKQTGGLTDTVPIFMPGSNWTLSKRTHAHRFSGLSGEAAYRVHQRRWTVTRAHVNDFLVAFVSLHLTQRCNRNLHPASYWCRARNFESAWIRNHVVPRLLGEGRTVIVGGDVNDVKVIPFGDRQDTTRADTMQASVIPAKGVTASIHLVKVLDRESADGLWTDHHTPESRVVLTR